MTKTKTGFLNICCEGLVFHFDILFLFQYSADTFVKYTNDTLLLLFTDGSFLALRWCPFSIHTVKLSERLKGIPLQILRVSLHLSGLFPAYCSHLDLPECQSLSSETRLCLVSSSCAVS